MRAAPLMALLLAAVLAIPGAAQAQADAEYTVSGIDYYYAAGTSASGHLALGSDGAAQELQAFSGCSWAKLRPDANRGRLQAIGEWGNVPLVVDASQFPLANRTPDSITHDGLVPASEVAVGTQWPASMLATTGNATVRLGGVPLDDPITGEPQFQATWFVTPQGFRDDADGGLVPQGREEWEMHLRVASPPGVPAQGEATWQSQQPDDGTPMLLPDEAYSRLFTIPNERLFGSARLEIEATGNGIPGANDLVFTVYAPDGTMLGESRLAPSLNAPESATLDVGLGQPGDYYVEVHGVVSLATYSLTFVQQPPEEFVLDLWWDDVRPGYAGLQEKEACADLFGAPSTASYIPPRPQPAPYDWTTTLFTVAAGLTLLAVAVSLGIAAYNAVAARHAMKG